MWGHRNFGKYPPAVYIKILEIVRFEQKYLLL